MNDKNTMTAPRREPLAKETIERLIEMAVYAEANSRDVGAREAYHDTAAVGLELLEARERILFLEGQILDCSGECILFWCEPKAKDAKEGAG